MIQKRSFTALRLGQKNWKRLSIVCVGVLGAAAIGVGALSGWPSWTGIGAGKSVSITTEKDAEGNITRIVETTDLEPGKTAWDWLELLVAPMFLVLIGASISEYLKTRDDKQREQEKRIEDLRLQQEKRIEDLRLQQEKEISADRIRQEALKEYIDQMTTLLLTELWPRKSDVLSELEERYTRITAIARARTLAVLRELDGQRKGSLIQFLVEAKAIDFISLEDADLSQAVLKSVNLKGVNLDRANFIDAILDECCLSSASLCEANLYRASLYNSQLTGANFTGARLKNTDLSLANFSNANLFAAVLSNSDLSDANFTNADLGGASLHSALLYRTKLSGASLAKATLVNAKMNASNLVGTDLSGADLTEADLSCADLTDAIFSKALLIYTEMSKAIGLTVRQIEQEPRPLICGAALPSSVIEAGIERSRDCNCSRVKRVLDAPVQITSEEAKAILENVKLD